MKTAFDELMKASSPLNYLITKEQYDRRTAQNAIEHAEKAICELKKLTGDE